MSDGDPPDRDVDTKAKLVEYGTEEYLQLWGKGEGETWIVSNCWMHRDEAV